MQALTAPALLGLWEAAYARPMSDRALLMLSGACPDEPEETLASLPVGERDARLLTLREWTFGDAVEAVAGCPECGEHCEIGFVIPEARAPFASADETACEIEVDSYTVAFRVPSAGDLAAVRGLDTGAARRLLLERCITEVRSRGKRPSTKRLPARIVAAVLERMAELDPQADVRTHVRCPACGHGWEAVFDVVSFFWAELDAWAHRTLHDVHVLATAYSWSESEILGLGPQRRRYYLELVQG